MSTSLSPCAARTVMHPVTRPSRKHAVPVAAFWLLAGAAGSASANINIEFDYTYDTNSFFADPNRKLVLEAAAQVFESRLTDSLTAITSGAGGNFNAVFFNPSATGTDLTLNSFSVAADEIRVFVGASALGGNILGVGGYGGFGVSGNQAFFDNARSRGQAGALAAAPTDFGPWGGSLGFSSTASWYFDTTPASVESFAGQSDFYSVAVHELGHLLGIGTAQSWDTRINLAGTHFVGPASGTVLLSPDDGHWADGTSSFVGLVAQEAAMDPSILVGTRKYFTTLDYAGLQDIGWQISAVPEPATWLLWGAGGALVAGLRRRAAPAERGLQA